MISGMMGRRGFIGLVGSAAVAGTLLVPKAVQLRPVFTRRKNFWGREVWRQIPWGELQKGDEVAIVEDGKVLDGKSYVLEANPYRREQDGELAIDCAPKAYLDPSEQQQILNLLV